MLDLVAFTVNSVVSKTVIQYFACDFVTRGFELVCVSAHVCVGAGVDSCAHTGDNKITTTYLNMKASNKSEF